MIAVAAVPAPRRARRAEPGEREQQGPPPEAADETPRPARYRPGLTGDDQIRRVPRQRVRLFLAVVQPGRIGIARLAAVTGTAVVRADTSG